MTDAALLDRLITVIEDEIAPLTREGVARGNKIFGAALLRKSDLSTVLAATNRETENPLFHGEIVAINSFYEMVNADESKRVDPKDMIFLSTHEPCTLCASAIAWAGYDTVYYFFSHEDSRDAFQIGHDLNILKALFHLEPGAYARQNAYWTARCLTDLVDGEPDGPARDALKARLAGLRGAYDDLSAVYQARKGDARNIPLK